MSNTTRQEVTLVVNQAVIKLTNGNVINTTAYKSTDRGIFVLTDNTANIFSISEGVGNKEMKLCFIPNERIDVVLYNVAKNDTTDTTQDPTDTPQTPLG